MHVYNGVLTILCLACFLLYFVFCVSAKVKLTVPLLRVCVHSACKGRPQNDLYCVGCDVKPYSLTQSLCVCIYALILSETLALYKSFTYLLTYIMLSVVCRKFILLDLLSSVMSRMTPAKFPKSCSRKFYLSRFAHVNSSISSTVPRISFLTLIAIHVKKTYQFTTVCKDDVMISVL